MSGRIIAAGIALALIVFAWQAGASFKGMVTHIRPSGMTTTASAVLPAVVTMHTAWGNVTCNLAHASYSCTTPPALYTVGAP